MQVLLFEKALAHWLLETKSLSSFFLGLQGKEILLYSDRIFHSAPDVTNRDGVWRFM